MKAGTDKQPGMIVAYGDLGTAWAMAFFYTTLPGRGGTMAQVYVPARRYISFHNDQLGSSRKNLDKERPYISGSKGTIPRTTRSYKKWGH